MTPPESAPAAPHVPRWERRKESRPAELLDAALDLFVERGYAATRLDDIATRAGVSKGTLYLYFANKEDLFKALVRENIVRLLDQFRAEIDDSDAPASELVDAFLRSWWRDFGGTRLAGLCKLIMSEAGNFPEVARFFHDEVIRPNDELFGSILARGIASGEFRAIDAQTATHLWISPLVMKSLWTYSFDLCGLDSASVDPERMLDTHVELILAALRPEPR